MLVLLCGLSFSGKSTVAQKLSRQLPAHVVSLDEINARRGLWGGDGIPVSEWAQTHQIASTEVRELLTSGATVVVDDTSSPRFLRDAWRALAAETGVEFALVYVKADEATIRTRRVQNQASPSRPDVTDPVFNHHLTTFDPPTPDEAALSVDQVLTSRCGVPKDG
ncbi:AAA family ATPase [Kribbella sp. NPDC004536]|uniref:AAA family ATPase n=1 Tax=Kribbella sp. NPDC004536 TaxID=3364106 RepID=UPI0036A31B1C